MIKHLSVTNEKVDAILFGMISQNEDYGLKLQALKIYYKKSGRLEGREKNQDKPKYINGLRQFDCVLERLLS
jgi:hypothetical protein